jgi:hypothetical protein
MSMSVSKIWICVAAVLLLCIAPRGKADVIDVCGAEKEDSVRLACFDRAVAARRAGVPETHESIRPVAFVARITAVHRVSPREFAFELDNGQVWQQSEEATGLDVRLQDSVKITPGVLGAFFMTTAQKQTFRVRRIR